MEALSHSLQPYKDVLGSVASFVTIAQFFSGVFICKNIHKKGSTSNIPATPFIGGVVIGTLVLKYAMILSDPAMLKVNIAAILMNALYVLFYYQYSTNKWEEVLKPMSIGAGLIAIFWGYAELEYADNIEYRYGFIVTVLQLLLLGAPLMDLLIGHLEAKPRPAASKILKSFMEKKWHISFFFSKSMIDKKDASSIPFPITFMAAIVTFLWLLYAIILMNNFMIVQNLIGFVLCMVQLVLIFLYPARNQNEREREES